MKAFFKSPTTYIVFELLFGVLAIGISLSRVLGIPRILWISATGGLIVGMVVLYAEARRSLFIPENQKRNTFLISDLPVSVMIFLIIVMIAQPRAREYVFLLLTGTFIFTQALGFLVMQLIFKRVLEWKSNHISH